MEQADPPDSADAHIWARLTKRQRACLDLLLLRKSSKQIARILNISKPTVDQRITAARKILGTANRDEAALRYGHLKAIYDRIIYDPVQLPSLPQLVPSDFPDGDPADAAALNDSAPTLEGLPGSLPPFRDFWRRNNELTRRTMIMAAMLVVVALLILAGLGIAQALTRLISS